MSDLAFYAIVISSSFFALTSLPQVFKPLEMGPKMYMTKLTSDKKALSQLTSLSMMWPVSVMQLCAVSIVGAFFGLTAPFVAVVAAFFATQLITFPTYVWGSAGEYIGMNKQMVIPQIAVMGSVLGMLVYSLFGELEAMPAEDLSLNAKIMIGFNSFYVLANLPGIFAPAFLGSQYFPGAFPKEKYAAAQMALMMRGLSIFNTFGPLTGLVAILSTSELFPVACAFLPFNFLCAAQLGPQFCAQFGAILRAILTPIAAPQLHAPLRVVHQGRRRDGRGRQRDALLAAVPGHRARHHHHDRPRRDVKPAEEPSDCGPCGA